MENEWKILQGDALTKLKEIPDETADMCVTSPPYYGLRSYNVDGQIGLEDTPDQYISALADVFDEVKRVLKPDGTLWVNIGDSYAGSGKGAWENKEAQKESYVPDSDSPQCKMPKTWDGIKAKDLIGIPWMLAFELRKRGWYLRQDIIWEKLNPVPESVMDRCTKSHEYIFLLSKQSRYYFDHDAMQEPAVKTAAFGENRTTRYGGKKYSGRPESFYRTKSGNAYNYTGYRNKRDVWSVATKPFMEAHFATYPEELIAPCVLVGSRDCGTVLDPFNGAGTTGVVCLKTGRKYLGIELNPEYIDISEKRLQKVKEQIEWEKAQISFFDTEETA